MFYIKDNGLKSGNILRSVLERESSAHGMKAERGSGGVNALSLKLGASSRWSIGLLVY